MTQYSLTDSLWSLVLTVSAEIASPAHLVTDQVTEDTATTSWDRVQALIDRYEVNDPSVDGDTAEREGGKNETAMTLTGLKPGVEYVIVFWAVQRERRAGLNLSRLVSRKDYGVLGTFRGHATSISLANVLFLCLRISLV